VPSIDSCDNFVWIGGPLEWFWVIVVFLDEATEGMDSQGREKLFALLSHLASSKSIYVIDHANMYQSLFDRTINVEKVNGESKII